MKGEFWFTSKLGKGSKFNFYLPLEEFAEDDEEQDILDSEEISCVLSIPSEAFIHNIKSRLVTEMVADNVSEHIDVDPFSLPPPIPLDSPILLPSLHNLPSKVLIVDDNSMNIFALKMLLTKLNVQTVSVNIYIYIYCIHIYDRHSMGKKELKNSREMTITDLFSWIVICL